MTNHLDITDPIHRKAHPLRKVFILIPGAEAMRDRIAAAFPDVSVTLEHPRDAGEAIVDAEMVIAWNVPVDVLDRAERLCWYHMGAAGVEHVINQEGFRDRKLVLTNSSGIAAPNMAEHAMALMLAFARMLPTLERSQRERHWQDWYAGVNSFELGGQTLVLAGLGAIGQEIARRAKAFGMHVIGVRRSAGGAVPANVDVVVAIDELDTALARADHVINTLPFTPDTGKFFDENRFAAMKQGAYFYNLGRGTTVDEPALIAALESGHLAGAGLDVTDPEPLEIDSPLWAMENVIITAHTSGNSPMVRERLTELCIEQIRRYRAGEPLLNVVDQQQGY